MVKIILLALFFCPSYLFSQITFTPKAGIEFSGLSYYPKSTNKQSDIKISTPDIEMFLSGEIGFQNKREKFSIALEMKNISEGVVVFNDSTVFPNNYGRIGKGRVGHFTGGTHTFVGLFYDRINNYFPSSKILSYFYGAGIGVGFNRTDAYYRETQNAGYSSAFWGGDNFTNIEMWNKPTGHGIFLKLRGGIALHNKKRKECVLLELFWNKGFRKMLEHTVNYSYGYSPLPGSGHSVTGYRFNSRGTTFGSTLGFPIRIVNPKSNRQATSIKTFDDYSLFSITPKIGVDFSNIGYFEKNSTPPNDLKVGPPYNNIFPSLELGYHKQKNKFSLGLVMQNLGKGVTVFNDSNVYATGISNAVYRSGS